MGWRAQAERGRQDITLFLTLCPQSWDFACSQSTSKPHPDVALCYHSMQQLQALAPELSHARALPGTSLFNSIEVSKSILGMLYGAAQVWKGGALCLLVPGAPRSPQLSIPFALPWLCSVEVRGSRARSTPRAVGVMALVLRWPQPLPPASAAAVAPSRRQAVRSPCSLASRRGVLRTPN